MTGRHQECTLACFCPEANMKFSWCTLKSYVLSMLVLTHLEKLKWTNEVSRCMIVLAFGLFAYSTNATCITPHFRNA